MPTPTKATKVGASLRACLETITQQNGYQTQLAAVYGPADKVREKPPTPYALVRPSADNRTGAAMQQATRVRMFEIEVVFSKAVEDPEAALDAVHVDILRALGFGRDNDRKFAGLIEDDDEATFRYAAENETTHSITISVGVLYVESYN
ncbi:hypothetical protein [Pseudomonas turukhanskensis]|uniref:Phage tail protein n=1 Tax=Pseudomonas turukhanskensis TaxID=1806536 RepID=A0A9W6NEU0_9PSED|nr:hypothetical protein [Pseudomonas turukhanskensis]GLK88318.1 hypothetical protein GCM10017655_13800 [Pseudomonas turukhanskensis]